jgi:hypothetical protein
VHAAVAQRCTDHAQATPTPCRQHALRCGVLRCAVLCCAVCRHQIRINPGNFADGRKTFEEINYDDPAQFEAERAHIEETFTPLVGGWHGVTRPRGGGGGV